MLNEEPRTSLEERRKLKNTFNVLDKIKAYLIRIFIFHFFFVFNNIFIQEFLLPSPFLADFPRSARMLFIAQNTKLKIFYNLISVSSLRLVLD